MDVLKLIHSYHFDIRNWENHIKMTDDYRQQIKQYLRKNRQYQFILIETFGQGYHNFVQPSRKKRLRKYINNT